MALNSTSAISLDMSSLNITMSRPSQRRPDAGLLGKLRQPQADVNIGKRRIDRHAVRIGQASQLQHLLCEDRPAALDYRIEQYLLEQVTLRMAATGLHHARHRRT